MKSKTYKIETYSKDGPDIHEFETAEIYKAYLQYLINANIKHKIIEEKED